jgi:hypothetical protein
MLISGALFLFTTWAFTSCEALSNCGHCKDVTYENGIVVNSSEETEYCGQELLDKKGTAPVTLGSLTTKVECR